MGFELRRKKMYEENERLEMVPIYLLPRKDNSLSVSDPTLAFNS